MLIKSSIFSRSLSFDKLRLFNSLKLKIFLFTSNPFFSFISNNGLKQFTALKKGAVKAGLGLDDIRSVWIPFPPLEEQEQIIAKIEQGFSLIENSQRIVNSTLQTLETMRMSVLKQAFKGKLVPQDPNDEPASILLEKIKNAQVAQKPKQRRAKNVK